MGLIKRALQLHVWDPVNAGDIFRTGTGIIFQPYVPLMVTHNIFTEDVKSRTFDLKFKK